MWDYCYCKFILKKISISCVYVLTTQALKEKLHMCGSIKDFNQP